MYLEVDFVENSKRLKENAQSIVAHYDIWHLPQIMDTKSKTSLIKCESRSLLLSQPAHVRVSQKSSVYNYNYDYNY